ncbi:hypothetical protein GJW-30_1_00389 [Variibacter gotjawalensis]|uniref:VWFA domain-containing protein n=1 Tax=Variibacter gotjawalensis TaxID=1333996 RepID=A0A0S3PPK9_9BRAD|nr:DUF1194 domain-containing protein [Variibacter gotjawalensis]NIK48176.1 hypothetical protein [Variibacter gotjawalensis]RZS50048.1 uncharacterized protein DUF1194 [Variibacter gotjawalensis]BAT57879.1 hypothetical protein GJW-30_1_00389 [Variibacter gotjawalensis]
MPRLTRRQFLTTAALAATAPAALAQSKEDVDLLLVLAADVSRSVDGPKFQLQRDGYAAALSDPRVLDAIKSGRRGKIAVCFVEWSGSSAQKVVIDWSIVKDEASARIFGDKLAELPRSFAERTSISAAIDYSVEQLKRAPFKAERHTIDVSGDGTNNSGRDVRGARDEAVAQGITINGLVILSERPLAWNPEHTHPEGGLGKYYRDNVMGGPGAFVVEAENFAAFGKALINKLVAEIALLDAPTSVIR